MSLFIAKEYAETELEIESWEIPRSQAPWITKVKIVTCISVLVLINPIPTLGVVDPPPSWFLFITAKVFN